jgi:hypothetical protein
MESIMKSVFSAAVLAGYTLTFAIFPAAAQTPQPQAGAAASNREIRPETARAGELAMKPELSRELTTQLGSVRRLRTPACTTQKAAFHVSGNWQGSTGADSPLVYPNIITNVGNYYANFFGLIGVFTAPCDGQYFFSVTFVKDNNYVCGGSVGTADDVNVYLTKFVGAATTVIDPGHTAWSGEGLGRGTGTYSVVLSLTGGDQIGTWVHSDGGPHRCLASYQFNGFRFAP